MPRIKHYWLASYPKSGNTWLRLFLSNLLNTESNEAININSISIGDIASSRRWVEGCLGIEIKELSDDEIDRLRPYAYQWCFEHNQYDSHTTHQFHKVHDACRVLSNGQALIPGQASSGAVYLVRNPLDIAVSGANHANISIDQAVGSLCDARFALAESPEKMDNQLRQFLGDWSNHVSSWLQNDMRKLIIRYEDMSHHPLPTFQHIARFLGLPSDADSVKAALLNCQFKTVQQQESEYGFNEKPPKATSFFRKGIVGDWVHHLDDSQVNAIINCHHSIMKKMGYLDSNGNPLITPNAIEN